MRRGTIGSFLGGLVTGTVLGALAAWLVTEQRRTAPSELPERANALLHQARTRSEHAAAALRSQLATVRQSIESRLAGIPNPAEQAPTQSVGEERVES